MLIDFHLHFFPDNIAEYTIEGIEKAAQVKAIGNGRLESIENMMDKYHIDYAVNLPVATDADQVKKINRAMIEHNRKNSQVLCFGAMHPMFREVGDVEEEIAFLAGHGVRGIKMHPEYQSFYPDDPDMFFIYEACLKNKMILLLHAGKDLPFKTVHATPQRLGQVGMFSSELKVVLAHMGGYRMWEDVAKYVMGLHEVYLDTAYCHEMEDWQMKEIIFGHGPYKILFGSDYPWQHPGVIVEKIKSLDLGAITENMIFFDNAKRLLNLELVPR